MNEVSSPVTVVVTSCGRYDLLIPTLHSFLEHNQFPIEKVLVVEDGPPIPEFVCQLFDDQLFSWINTNERVGQIAAIDLAYSQVKTPYIFHMEDDWEFTAGGFIEDSLEILRSNPLCLQVWIRGLDDTNGHPVLGYTYSSNGVSWKKLAFDHLGKWNGFSFNPGLKRIRDYTAINGYGVNARFDKHNPASSEMCIGQIYRKRDFFAAILSERECGHVRTLGVGRHVCANHIPSLKNYSRQTSITHDSRNKGIVPKASLIVPCYNVGNYILNCLKSVSALLISGDTELIVINDGSQDLTLEQIVNGINMLRLNNVVVIDRPNRGLSETRNLGASLARGRYIAFLDSDDAISSGTFNNMLAAAISESCDIVLGKIIIVNDESKHRSQCSHDWAWQLLVRQQTTVIQDLPQTRRLAHYLLLCLEPNANYKIINRSFYLINQFRFPDGLVYEDMAVHIPLILAANIVSLVDEPYLHYTTSRPGQITSCTDSRRKDLIGVLSTTIDAIQNLHLTPAEGAAIAYNFLRIAWWNSTLMQFTDRHEYFCELSRIMRTLWKEDYRDAFRGLGFPEHHLHLVLDCLLHNRTNILQAKARGVKLNWRHSFSLASIYGPVFLVKLFLLRYIFSRPS